MDRIENLDRLRTVSQLEVNKFCDFIGEVCYYKLDSGNRATLVMTDYTEHDSLPIVEGEGRVGGKATILVTLWDEHCEEAQRLNVGAGMFLLLKNLCCKLNKSQYIELNMNGFRGKGYQRSQPVQILDPKDALVRDLRLRKSRYLHGLGTDTPGTIYAQIAARSMRASSIVATATPAPIVSSSSSRTRDISPGPLPETTTVSTSKTVQEPQDLTHILKKETESLVKVTPVLRPSTSPSRPSTRHNPSSSRALLLTGLLTSRMELECRNDASDDIQYLRLHACVVGFEPEHIMDFSFASCSNCGYRYGPLSDDKPPNKCPSCRSGSGGVIFKYSFMLKLMDEFQQTFNVYVDNESAITLVGADAANYIKKSERLAELKQKLARIGVMDGGAFGGRTKSSLESPIYFDMYIKLVKVASQSTTISLSSSLPIKRSISQEYAPNTQCNSEFGDGDFPLECLDYSTQPSQLLSQSQKRRTDGSDMVENSKRPCSNSNRATGNNHSRTQGSVLQRVNEKALADFEAFLVHTMIK